VRAFDRDTAVVIGADTVRLFLLPGHTAGSAAYLVRGILFVGDALSYAPLWGFKDAVGRFTYDAEANRESLSSLRERVAPYRVEWVCTAHAKCARPEALRRKGLW
jgi:glyoxylase-like metal-dependent hydrolase (beta-lactamase superfamily II)